MQKLIILDSETGIAHIFNVPLDFESDSYDTDEPDNITIDSICEKFGGIANSCQWMVALEINDTTI